MTQKRHRVIEIQKKRLDKADEGRAKSRTLFNEIIDKVRIEVEQQEIMQTQLDDAHARNEVLEGQVSPLFSMLYLRDRTDVLTPDLLQLAELRWEREQEGVVGTLRELTAERNLMQEALARMREELKAKDDKVGQLPLPSRLDFVPLLSGRGSADASTAAFKQIAEIAHAYAESITHVQALNGELAAMAQRVEALSHDRCVRRI